MTLLSALSLAQDIPGFKMRIDEALRSVSALPNALVQGDHVELKGRAIVVIKSLLADLELRR
jgi:hypothetical protein